VRRSFHAFPPGDVAVAGVALGAAWALKAFYSLADAGALQWILAPTVRLAQWASGVAFAWEPHVGWMSRETLFLVAPACAGVNFLIAAFVSLCLGLAPACRGTGERAALVAGSAVAAYAATVLANATRIALAVRLHAAGAAWGPLSPERLHCALGVAVYFGFLLALFALSSRAIEARRATA
jgi:exosortase K